MSDIRIMQGDQYPIAFELFNEGSEEPFGPQDLADIEVVIGQLTFRMTDGGILWNDDHWEFYLTQDASFSLEAFAQSAQIRVKLNSGAVIGQELPLTDILRSISKEVL